MLDVESHPVTKLLWLAKAEVGVSRVMFTCRSSPLASFHPPPPPFPSLTRVPVPDLVSLVVLDLWRKHCYELESAMGRRRGMLTERRR